MTERGAAGPDGGVDVELRMGKDKYVVQCKHWKAQAVGVSIVRELFGVMTAEGAAGGFVVASGPFTAEAAKFVDGRPIQLVDATRLIAGVSLPHADIAATTSKPVCPLCGKQMVKRMARKGTNAGSTFWGCPAFPGCRGTRAH